MNGLATLWIICVVWTWLLLFAQLCPGIPPLFHCFPELASSLHSYLSTTLWSPVFALDLLYLACLPTGPLKKFFSFIPIFLLLEQERIEPSQEGSATLFDLNGIQWKQTMGDLHLCANWLSHNDQKKWEDHQCVLPFPPSVCRLRCDKQGQEGQMHAAIFKCILPMEALHLLQSF